MKEMIRKLLEPRTVISFMLYGTFCTLCIKKVIEPDAIIAVVSSLMTFYFARKLANGKPTNVPNEKV